MIKSKSKNKKYNRLFVFHCKKSRKNFITKKYYSKCLCFHSNFSNSKFKYVNLSGSIMTNCNFSNCNFISCDFKGSNFSKSNFSGAKFYNCIFYGTIVKKVKFANCSFINCIFINVKYNNLINIPQESNKIYKTEIKQQIQEELINEIIKLNENKNLHNYRILKLKNNRLNITTLNILLSKYDENTLIKCFQNIKIATKVLTTFQFIDIVNKFMQKSKRSAPFNREIENSNK